MDAVGDFDVAVGGQRVHIDRVRLGEFHAPLVGDPGRILFDDLGSCFSSAVWTIAPQDLA